MRGDIEFRRGGNVEIPYDTEMQILTHCKIHRASNDENEAGALQALAIVGYLATVREGWEVLGNQNVLSVRGRCCRN